MFSFHTTSVKFKTTAVIGHFGFVFQKIPHRFQNVICPHENEKPAFSNSSGLKSVLEKRISVEGRPNRRNKAPFRDGLVWRVGLTVEIKLRFVTD